MNKLISALFILSQFCFGQNLVPNGDFEQYTTCPYSFQYLAATNWSHPTSGTADYFNSCSNTSYSNLGIPSNISGVQDARSGSGYCGFSVFYNINPSVTDREYLQVQLITPLVAGSTYDFKMYVSLGENSLLGISDLGVYFSNGNTFISGNDELPFSPQIISNQMISDYSNWTLIEGSFIASGGEDHIIIGNFNNDANTNFSVNNNGPGLYNSSYYYVDDISLKLAPVQPNLGSDTTLCNNETLTLDATTSSATYLWQDNSTNSTFQVAESGTYWVEVSTDNHVFIDSINISVVNCEIVIELPNVITPNSDQVNDLFVPIVLQGIISMNTTICNRWGNKIYQTDKLLIEWDGKNVNEGTYFWDIDYVDKNGINNHLNGFVTVLK